MKKYLFLLLAMPLLMACQQEEPNRKIVGEYTYNISGNVRWWGANNDGEYAALEPEKGNLVISAEKNGTCLATFYTENGDFFTCEAEASEDEIFLSHGRRNIKINDLDCSAIFSSEICHLTANGFNGNLVYQGNPLGDYTKSFVSDHVSITATKIR